MQHQTPTKRDLAIQEILDLAASEGLALAMPADLIATIEATGAVVDLATGAILPDLATRGDIFDFAPDAPLPPIAAAIEVPPALIFADDGHPDWYAFTTAWMAYCQRQRLNRSYCRLAVAMAEADEHKSGGEWAYYINVARNTANAYHNRATS